MKFSNKIIGGLLVVIVIVVIGVFFQPSVPLKTPILEEEKDFYPPTDLTLPSWKTYENTKYNYRLKYPPTGTVQQKYGEGMEPDQKTLHSISFGIGKTTLVGVFVPEFYLDANNTISEFVSTAKNILSLDLKSFVQEIRRYQMEYVKNNPNYSIDYKNLIKIGEVTKLNFLGNDAYSFTLVGTLNTPIQGPLVRSRHETHKYIFVDHNGTRYIIVSTDNDSLAESILNTFQFTN